MPSHGRIVYCPESDRIRARLSCLSELRETGPLRTAAEVRDIFFSLEPMQSDVMQGRQYLRFAWKMRARSDIPYKDWQDKTFRATSANHFLTPAPKVSAQEVAQLTVAADFDVLKPYVALRRGEAIILPVDNGSLSFTAKKTPSAANGELFGIKISIPDTLPRLAMEFSIPSFWIYSNWQNGQLRYDIQRLPDPAEGETKQDWHNRWAAAYLHYLEEAMRATPENLNITAPLWRYLLLNSEKCH